MMVNRPLIVWLIVLFGLVSMTGCDFISNDELSNGAVFPIESPEIEITNIPTRSTPTSITLTPTLEFNSPIQLHTDPLPESVQASLANGRNIEWVENDELADYSIKIAQSGGVRGAVLIQWVYTIAAAFPTVQDEITLEEVVSCWRGTCGGEFRLLVAEETFPIFDSLWGHADLQSVLILPADKLLEKAWQERDLRVILPFEYLEPRWKVLRVDGKSPLDQNFTAGDYGLTVQWEGFVQNKNKAIDFAQKPEAIITNRQPEKFTSLILTGTTALVRNTAERMELKGLEYPLQDIGEWLRGADITHVSNEVSFYENCPPALPVRGGQRFCTSPRYVEFLKMAGVDVVELTGNHLLDWGTEPFLYTLDLYNQNGIKYYGGGRNLEEARQPLLIEHHGNLLALIGCNRAGPDNIWATIDQPGPAPCDMNELENEIRNVMALGYLPIVTFQHYEVEDFMPMNLTLQEFEQAAQAGAVIVSGSQAHFAHGFGFYQDHFMHYGLGNLFFDQMFPLHRRQFVDRHVFYDGRYLGVELLTTILEDYSRPRPMTKDERVEMLEDYFRVSGWLESEKP